MTQDQLDAVNKEATDCMEQFLNGLITIVEFAKFMSVLDRKFTADPDLYGLLDPNTGLRFPTKEETDAFMASVDLRMEEQKLPVVG